MVTLHYNESASCTTNRPSSYCTYSLFPTVSYTLAGLSPTFFQEADVSITEIKAWRLIRLYVPWTTPTPTHMHANTHAHTHTCINLMKHNKQVVQSYSHVAIGQTQTHRANTLIKHNTDTHTHTGGMWLKQDPLLWKSQTELSGALEINSKHW